jgi:hypothetical protein
VVALALLDAALVVALDPPEPGEPPLPVPLDEFDPAEQPSSAASVTSEIPRLPW